MGAQTARWDGIGAAREALTRYAAPFRGELHRINFGENTTFRVKAPDSTYALRLYRPRRWSPEAVQAEHEFMRFLGEGLNVFPPVEAEDGATLQRLSNGTLAAMFRWVPGRVVNYGGGAAHMLRIGAFLARLHTRGLEFSDANRRIRWNQQELLRKSLKTIEAKWDRLFPEMPYDWGTRVELLEELWTELAPEEGFVHGDLHATNLKFHQGRIYPIDFDDFGYGPLAYEFGVFGYNNIDAPELFEPLLEGYNLLAPGFVSLDAMYLFTGVRVVYLMAWLLNKSSAYEQEELEHSADVNVRTMTMALRALGLGA